VANAQVILPLDYEEQYEDCGVQLLLIDFVGGEREGERGK